MTASYCVGGSCPPGKFQLAGTMCFHADQSYGICDGKGACGPALYTCAPGSAPICNCSQLKFEPKASCPSPLHPYAWSCQEVMGSKLIDVPAAGSGCVQGPYDLGFDGYKLCCELHG